MPWVARSCYGLRVIVFCSCAKHFYSPSMIESCSFWFAVSGADNGNLRALNRLVEFGFVVSAVRPRDRGTTTRDRARKAFYLLYVA